MRRSTLFLYSGVRVRNLRRSLRFYRALGFRVVKRGSFTHGGRYVHLGLPDANHRIELNYYPKRSPYWVPFRRGEEFDHFGFYAEDPEAWLARARRAGARWRTGYADRPGQQLYFVSDPDGVWLGVFGPLRSKPRPSSRNGPVRRRSAQGRVGSSARKTSPSR